MTAPQSTRVQTGGILTACTLAGEGDRTILFSNALGTDAGVWRPQAEAALAAGYRILTYDHPGHGTSEVRMGSYGIGQLARDVIDMLDAFEIPRADICGLSMGGLIGQHLSIHHPDRVSSLTLVATATSFPPSTLWNDRIADAHELGLEALATGHAGRWFTRLTHETHPDLVAQFREGLAGMEVVAYANACIAIRDASYEDAIPSITCPTIAIAGAEDVATTPDRMRQLAEAIPEAVLHVIENAAHFPTIERPEVVSGILLNHWRNVS